MAKSDIPSVGPERGDTNGLDAVSKALGDIDFPAPLTELLDRVGNRTIEYRKGHDVTLRHVLTRLGQHHFTSLGELLAAIRSEMQIEGLTDQDQAA